MSEVRYVIGYQCKGHLNHFEVDISFEDLTELRQRFDFHKARLSGGGHRLIIDEPCSLCKRYKKDVGAVEAPIADLKASLCRECPFFKYAEDGSLGCVNVLMKIAKGEGLISEESGIRTFDGLLSVSEMCLTWQVEKHALVLKYFKAINKVLEYARRYNTMHKFVFEIKPTLIETVEAETVEDAEVLLTNFYRNKDNAGKIKVWDARHYDIKHIHTQFGEKEHA